MDEHRQCVTGLSPAYTDSNEANHGSEHHDGLGPPGQQPTPALSPRTQPRTRQFSSSSIENAR
ncbi:ATP-dependent Clp protease ATP-binding subunit ClpX, partial [Clarias magur]